MFVHHVFLLNSLGSESFLSVHLPLCEKDATMPDQKRFRSIQDALPQTPVVFIGDNPAFEEGAPLPLRSGCEDASQLLRLQWGEM